jgi:hypothetical protein
MFQIEVKIFTKNFLTGFAFEESLVRLIDCTVVIELETASRLGQRFTQVCD